MSDPVNVRSMIGKRLLCSVKTGRWAEPGVEEIKILEVSPSGQWSKVINIHGLKHWRPTTNLAIIEELTPLDPGPSEPKPES